MKGMNLIIAWCVLAILFTLALMVSINLPFWIKDNSEYSVLVNLMLFVPLALGFTFVLSKSIR